MGTAYETVTRRPAPARHRGRRPDAAVARPDAGSVRDGSAAAGPGAAAQNLMPPIMPAMFVVSSLIVGAIDELAR